MITQILQLDSGFEHYLPVAKNLARQIFATGQESFSNTYPVVAADGVQGGRITIHGSTDQNLNTQTIKIQLIGDTGVPYLDSGLVDVIATRGPHKYDNGEIFTGDALNSNKSWGVMNPNTLQHTPSKDSANPLAVPPILPVVDGAVCGAFEAVYPPEPTEAEKLADPTAYQAWLDAKTSLGDQLVTKKTYAASFPSCIPSLFSGKARLWVQSVWGKKFSVAEVAKYVGSGKDGLVIELPKDGRTHVEMGQEVPTIEKHTLRSAITGSDGVYTDANFNYWQISIGHPATTVCRLRLSYVGRAVIALMKSGIASGAVQNTRAGRAKFEAIALSTAVPDHASKWVQIPTIGVSTVATPLYYWWSWTWDGSKADVITHEQKTVTGTTSTQAGFIYYTAHHYRFTVSRDVAKVLTAGQTEVDRWASKIEQVEQGDWWPAMDGVPRQVVWVPEIGEQIGLAPYGATNMLYPPPPLPGSANIYCFYDVDDVLKTFDIGYSESGSAVGTTIEYSNYDPTPANPLTEGVPALSNKTAPTQGDHSVYTHTSIVEQHINLAGVSISVSASTGGSRTTYTIGAEVELPVNPTPGSTIPNLRIGATYWWSYSAWTLPWMCRAKVAYAGTLASAISDGLIVGRAGDGTGAPFWPYADAVRRNTSPVSITSTTGITKTKTGNLVLGIPYGDCAAAYVARSSRTDETGTSASLSSAVAITSLTAEYVVATAPSYVAAEEAKQTNPYFELLPVTSISSSVPDPTATSTASFKCHSYAGVKDADTSYMTEIFMTCPHWFRRDYGGIYTNADMLYTTSSAVTGDVIGKTFTTGGYSGVPGDAGNKAFIGFA